VVALASVALIVVLAHEPETRASDAPPATSGVEPVPAAPPPTPALEPKPAQPNRSRAVGLPYAGHLLRGVRLLAAGVDFFTWDPVLKRSPNRGWRRYGTDRLLETIAQVLREYRARHPDAPRAAIGDLSRPRGGDFGPRFGGPGHASHQNGLDVDIYYPRRDRLERAPRSPAMVDRQLSQDLVDLFVDAGAQYVFVGPHVGLRGPRRVVQPLLGHDDHMHVRIRPR
jgi:murein endopeptidase